VGLGPDGDWLYPFSPAVRGEGAQWLMFFAQAGAPNYYNPDYRYYGYPGERRSYEEHPGVGEYMCFDALMQADLEEYARKMGREHWYAAGHLRLHGEKRSPKLVCGNNQKMYRLVLLQCMTSLFMYSRCTQIQNNRANGTSSLHLITAGLQWVFPESPATMEGFAAWGFPTFTSLYSHCKHPA
jgi:hypothetical protein